MQQNITDSGPRGIRTAVVVPFPRLDVTPEIYHEYRQMLLNEVAGYRETEGTDVVGKFNDEEYYEWVKENTNKKNPQDRGGIHIQCDILQPVVYCSLTSLGLQVPELDLAEGTEIKPGHYLPWDRCSVCGDRHNKQKDDCDRERTKSCHRCWGRRHNH